MWPILIGFMFGVVVYVAVMWVHNQYGTLNDILDDIRVPFWLRALLVLMTSAMCLAALFLFVHVWPPLTVTFEHTMKGWELFWAIFYGSNFLSVFLGFVLGIFVTDWVVDARRANAAHVGKRGIAIAVFTAITILVGLDHNLNFLNRVNKVSTSVISFELDNRHAANTLARGFLAQAFLYRADAQKSKKALCRSFKAAAISNKLAGMPRRVDFSDYQQFLKSSLATNGSAISKFRFKQDTIDNLRASREQVEALGEGCVQRFFGQCFRAVD
jgi:hypothetical protein